METRTKQVNIRFTKEELEAVKKRSSERSQKIQEFLRDLLKFGMLPEPVSRQ